MAISNYSKALFQIAHANDQIDQVALSFNQFMDEIKENGEWMTMIDSPMIPFSEKEKMIDALGLHGSFLSFIKMLVEKNHVHYIYDIYPQWVDLTRAYLKIAHIHLYSAKEVSAETEEKLKKVVQPMFPHHTISFHITIDPKLLGGIKMVHQGQSLDRSVARELEELYTTI